MKGWKSYLLWEGLPFLMLLFCFAFTSSRNWDYEKKLITPNNGGSDWTNVHLGLIMLAAAIGFAIVASFILFIVRITRPKACGEWYMFISLTVTAIFLIFPSLFIVLMGPAVITIMEHMSQASGQ